MDRYLLFLILIWHATCLMGQEKKVNEVDRKDSEPKLLTEKETPVKNAVRSRKTRRLDDTRPNFISIRGGASNGLLNTRGGIFEVEFERPFKYKPLRWYLGISHGISDKEGLVDLELSRSTLNYGMRLYPCGFNRSWKPYIGVGAFTGNLQYKEVFKDEVTEEKNGLIFGAHSIFGLRWGKGLIRFGFEYRGGYMQSKMYGDNKSSAYHEFNCMVGFQF